MTLLFDKKDHSYRLENKGGSERVFSVTQAMNTAGLIETKWFTEESRQRGSAVHTAIWYYNDGDLDIDTLREEIAGHFYAYIKFLKETKFQPIAWERRSYHPIWRYAGTPDMLGLLNGKPCIIDFKSGLVPSCAAIQTAAYTELIKYIEGKKIFDGIDTDKILRVGLELKNNGTYKLTEFVNRSDFRTFLSCLTVSNWKLQNGGFKWN